MVAGRTSSWEASIDPNLVRNTVGTVDSEFLESPRSVKGIDLPQVRPYALQRRPLTVDIPATLSGRDAVPVAIRHWSQLGPLTTPVATRMGVIMVSLSSPHRRRCPCGRCCAGQPKSVELGGWMCHHWQWTTIFMGK